MTWPASDVNNTSTDQGTDQPAVARGHLNDLINKFNQLRGHVTTQWRGILGQNGAYSPALGLVPYGSVHNPTPTVDAAASNMHEMPTLTGNITALSISGAQPGMCINIRFQQDTTGGRTVALNAPVFIVGAINLTGGKVSWLSMFYSGRASRWEGAWTNMP